MSTIYEKEISADFQKFINYTNENRYFWAEFSIIDKDDDFLEIWVDTWDWSGADLNIAKRDLIPLGQADGTGGYFAFWDEGKNKAIEEMPIIILGSEGEMPIIAQNLKELMRLMTTGDELFIDTSSASCNEDSIGQFNEAYVQWVKKEFNLDPIQTADEANEIIKNAKKTLGKEFEIWAQKALDPGFTIADQ